MVGDEFVRNRGKLLGDALHHREPSKPATTRAAGLENSERFVRQREVDERAHITALP